MDREDAVSRFARDYAALAPEGAAGPIGVAVSGGADSLALLLLADAAFPGKVRAATVDHRLRSESAAEAAFVARLCHDRGIPHAILPADVQRRGEGLQAAARAARYAALAEWMRRTGTTILLTGHHADDQAETLLMRLNRGSGVAGLAGIRSVTPLRAAGEAATILRPLLAWRREALFDVVREARVTPIADPSNTDDAYDRVRLRKRLEETEWLDRAALARSAAALGEAEEALAFAAEAVLRERVRRAERTLTFDPAGLPAELVRRAVGRVLADLDASPRGEQLTAVIAQLRAGRTTTLAGVKCLGGSTWRFEPAPPRRSG